MSKEIMQNLTDNEIIESVLRGNTRDYGLLIDRYKHRAYSLLKRMLKNDFDADEVLQDSFVKAYFNLKSFRADSKFSTWFFRIVYNSALNKFSSKRYQNDAQTNSIDDKINFIRILPEEGFHTDSKDLLKKLVMVLPPKHATVINLFYYERMTCEEIAKIMNLSANNIKVLLHRGRKQIKEEIEKNNLKDELL